jgi:hypothetical protein
MFNKNEIAYGPEIKLSGLFIMENLAWHVQIHASLSRVYD